MAEATRTAAKAEPIRMVGEVVMKRLSLVKPNDWNPNRMTPQERASMKYGFETDGWLLSQSLLIWGKDEKGSKRNVIIDGEQRWTVATEMRLALGPMVFLDGLTEAEAKELTIKMDKRRGNFAEEPLADLLRSLREGKDDQTFALSLGFEDAEMSRLLAHESGSFLNDLAGGPTPTGTDYHSTTETTSRKDGETGEEFVKLSLYLKSTDHAIVIGALAEAKKRYGVKTNVEALIKIVEHRTGSTKKALAS